MPKDSSFNSFSFTYITNNSNMIIDFNNIKEQALQNFKGGNGELDTRNYVDDKCKIMLSHLKPGANSGYHKHEGSGDKERKGCDYVRKNIVSPLLQFLSICRPFQSNNCTDTSFLCHFQVFYII